MSYRNRYNKSQRQLRNNTMVPRQQVVGDPISKQPVKTKLSKHPGVINRIYDITTNLIEREANEALDLITPDDLENSNQEEFQEKVKERAELVAEVLDQLAEDPQMQQLLDQSGEAFAKLTDELMDAVDEPIEEMYSKGLDLISRLVVATGESIVKTGTKLVMSMIAEVPGLGGVVDLGMTVLTAFNGIAKNIYITADNLEQIITIGNRLIGDVLKPVEYSLDEFDELEGRAEVVYDQIHNTLDEWERRLTDEAGPDLSKKKTLDTTDKRLNQPTNVFVPKPQANVRVNQPTNVFTPTPEQRKDTRLTQPTNVFVPTSLSPAPRVRTPVTTRARSVSPAPRVRTPVTTRARSVSPAPTIKLNKKMKSMKKQKQGKKKQKSVKNR
jgi:hypothetical protein